MSDERRKESRFLAWIPVEVDAGDGGGLALSRDLSEHGVLLTGPDRPTIGATVTLKFRTPIENTERVLQGTIVRTSEGEDDAYPYRMAVEFDEAVPGLQALLEKAVRGETTDG